MKINYFNFRQKDKKYFLTNELGEYCFLDTHEFQNLIHNQFENMDEDVLQDLKEKFFIYDEEDDVFIEKVYRLYRDNKSYLFSGTCLHIFVVTNNCNMNCIYCQAQDAEQSKKGMMNCETARKAVDIALQSPERSLTFEFQGGEPLLNFDVIQFIVNYCNSRNNDRQINYSLVTNTLLLKDDMIDFFKENDISVSVSLDGDKEVHNCNRPMKNGMGTFDIVIANIDKLKKAGIHVGAIQTTTRQSIEYPKAIVDIYTQAGLNYLFIRPLTPLGYAKEHWKEIGYTPEEFIDFYRKILNIIIDCNKHGIPIVEGHASIFLRKILGHYSDNYMELRSPCGAGIGQIAYYYDGNIYTCDEARMLAEMGNGAFCLGNVSDCSYSDLMENNICKVTCQASVMESLPSCADCVYHPFCGVCPVVNLAVQSNIYERQPNSYRCKIYKGILDTIFEWLYRDEHSINIFKTWI